MSPVLAEADATTVTLPSVHTALAWACASQLALQSTSALQLGGVTLPWHFGAVNMTSQLPLHSPMQLALAEPGITLHDPVQDPAHLPSHLPLHMASQVPLQVPVQVPVQLPWASMAEQVPS